MNTRSYGTVDNGSLNSPISHINFFVLSEKRVTAPWFPPEWYQRWSEHLYDERNVPYPTNHHKRIHNRALEEFVKVGKGGSFEDISNGVHVLILRVLNEPHRPRTHDLATTTEEDGEHVPAQRVRKTRNLRMVSEMNVNVIPTTQW